MAQWQEYLTKNDNPSDFLKGVYMEHLIMGLVNEIPLLSTNYATSILTSITLSLIQV